MGFISFSLEFYKNELQKKFHIFPKLLFVLSYILNHPLTLAVFEVQARHAEESSSSFTVS